MIAAFASVVFSYGAAGFAFGYVFIPGRRGGVVFDGIPAYLIATAILCCFAILFLLIVDHYDRRPNEHTYRAWYKGLFKAAIGIVIAAVALSLGEALRMYRLPFLPGFAADYSLYLPASASLHPTLHEAREWMTPILMAGVAVGMGGGLLHKKMPRAGLFLMGFMMLCMSVGMLMKTAEFYSEGAGLMPRRLPNIRAYENPALFGASVFFHVSLILVMLCIGLAGMLAPFTKKISSFNSGVRDSA